MDFEGHRVALRRLQGQPLEQILDNNSRIIYSYKYSVEDNLKNIARYIRAYLSDKQGSVAKCQ